MTETTDRHREEARDLMSNLDVNDVSYREVVIAEFLANYEQSIIDMVRGRISRGLEGLMYQWVRPSTDKDYE